VIKSGRLSWAERVANKGDRKGSYRFLVGGGGTSGNRQLGRSKRRWEVIKMDLKEIGWEGVLTWLRTGMD